MDLLHRQHEIEQEMIGLGATAYQREKEKAKERKQESSLPTMQTLTAAVIPPLAEAIREFTESALNTGKAGPRNRAAIYLKEFEPEVVAMITMRRLLDSTDRVALSAKATLIGNALMLEHRLEEWSKQSPEYRSVLHHFVTDHHGHRQRVFQYHLKHAEIPRWPYRDAVRVGTKCIELAIETTGLFTLRKHRTKGKRTPYVIQPTERLFAWVQQQDARCELMQPFWLPMVVPPVPWDENGDSGGYLTIEQHNLWSGDAPAVVEAVNHVQATPWRINKRVLEVLKETWEQSHSVGKVPHREEVPLPLCPACGLAVESKAEGGHRCLDESEEIRKEWRKQARRIWDLRTSLLGRRLQVTKVLWIAEMFKDYERIYFPHKLDFRGRMYPRPVYLQPQGVDYSRACLEFAEGKPIETPEALGWLMIHGANCWGHDKVDLEDRIRWVEENNAEITRSGLDPYGCRFWTEADKPWQFLAFCVEYAAFIDRGYGFVSHLPITVDGSCNGLQHFSAMLRDEVGGRAVNLVPQEKPADVYQEVADVVIRRLEFISPWHCGAQGGDTPENELLAKQWIQFGINRKAVKRSVMIVPYSGTKKACQKYILEYIEDRGDHPFEDPFKASRFLANHVWEAIEQVVKSSREAMNWLRACVKVHNQLNKPLTWVNPLGFELRQFYPDWGDLEVETKFGERVMKLYLKDEHKDKVKRDRQLNGISPNYVHCLDAAALMQTVCYGADNGVSSWMVIHDCYGTHAADMEMLGACLREAFVDLYMDTDVLKSFYEQIREQLPDHLKEQIVLPPQCGGLDLEAVRHSDFFFA